MINEKRKFIVFRNETFEEEKALVEIVGDMRKIIVKGDYYHDKIDEKIEGFFLALDYLDVEYNLEELSLSSGTPLFEELEFYNDSFDMDFDNYDNNDNEEIGTKEEKENNEDNKENEKKDEKEKKTKKMFLVTKQETNNVENDFSKEEDLRIYEIKSNYREIIIKAHPFVAILWAWNYSAKLIDVETKELIYDFTQEMDESKKTKINIGNDIEYIVDNFNYEFLYKGIEIDIDGILEKYDLKKIKLTPNEYYTYIMEKGEKMLWNCWIPSKEKYINFYATPIIAVIYAWNHCTELYRVEGNNSTLVYADEFTDRENNESLAPYHIICKDNNCLGKEDVDTEHRTFYLKGNQVRTSIVCKECKPLFV